MVAERTISKGAERAVSDDEVAALEEQREYLLKSLDDLEQEYAAGDIDEVDYAELKDDYTARAAAMIRTIDARKARVASAAKGGSRRLLWLGGIVVIAVLAGIFIGQASGTRRAGEVGSGDIRASTRTLLIQADDALQNQRFEEAIELYDEVLEVEPSNVEAITYRAWVGYRMDPVAELALPGFEEAIAFEPDYSDARVFNAIVLLDDDQPIAAAEQLKAFDATEPPPFMQSLVDDRSLRENIMVALFGAEEPVPIDDTAFDVDEVVAVARSLAQFAAVNEAKALFDAVLVAEPDHVEAHTYAGWMLAQLWNTPELTTDLDDSEVDDLLESAFGFLDTALEIDPTYPDALVYRAFFRRATDDPQGAAADLNVFNELTDQPPQLVGLIEQFDLAEVLEETS